MAWFEFGEARINYEEMGSGTPVLMLPGWSMPIESFGGLPARLPAASYRVISADLPGSGRSLPQPRNYTVNYYEDDAAAFAALLQHLGAAPAHLIGFSDGGEDALLMAALTPAVARSVVTWGAGGQASDPSGQLRQVLFNLVDHPIPPMQGFRDNLVQMYGEANARANSQSLVRALGEIIDTRGGNLALGRASDITCPVLLITGEHDVFVPPALLAQMAAELRTVEMQVVPGAPHDVLNAAPEWTAETLLAWLGRH